MRHFRLWWVFAALSFVAILVVLGLTVLVRARDAGLSRHTVAMVRVAELSREVLGTPNAEFPVVIRLDGTGHVLGMLHGFPEDAASKLDELGNARRFDGDAQRTIAGLNMVIPMAASSENVVLITLTGGCEPCSQMDEEFLRFSRRRTDLASFVVEAHVDAR